MRMRKRNAFTLIELLLVLVILAILAAVVVPKFTNRSEQARDAAAKTDIANMETALDTFEIDNGRYPATEEGLGALSSQPANAPNWKGPYMKKAIANDPWGSPYIYKFPGSHTQNGYDLYSWGPDKRESEDDIGNWSK